MPVPDVLMRSPPAGVLGERVELGLKLGAGHRADHLVGNLAPLYEEDRWNRADPVARGKTGVLVHVDFRERHLARRLPGYVLEDRRDGATGAAPLGPEVDHHDSSITAERLVEISLGQVDRPRVRHLGLLSKKSTTTLTWAPTGRKERHPETAHIACQFDTSIVLESMNSHGSRKDPRSRRRALDPQAPEGSPYSMGLPGGVRRHRKRGPRSDPDRALRRRDHGYPDARDERARPSPRDQAPRRFHRGRRDDGISDDRLRRRGPQGRRLRLPFEAADPGRAAPPDGAGYRASLPQGRGAVAPRAPGRGAHRQRADRQRAAYAAGEGDHRQGGHDGLAGAHRGGQRHRQGARRGGDPPALVS